METMKLILALIGLVLGKNVVVSHHDISATVQMVDGIYCSKPSFPFARNIDCNGPLRPGTHCDHQCGGVSVRSTCHSILTEAFGLKINTGKVKLTFDKECIIKIVEQKTSISGIKTIAQSEDECVDYINTEVAPKIREKLMSKCDGVCEVDFNAQCNEPKRRRRSDHIEFNVNMDLTVKGADGVKEVTSDDITAVTGDMEINADTIEVASEPATEKIEKIAPKIIVDEENAETEKPVEKPDVGIDSVNGLTKEDVEKLFGDLNHDLENKVKELENENLELLVKIKLMEDNTDALENTVESFESKMKKTRLLSIVQNSQTQNDMMNMKKAIDQIITYFTTKKSY